MDKGSVCAKGPATHSVICILLFSVIDLKDLKVYEGVAENADSTLVGDEETIVKLIRKEVTFADASAQVSNTTDIRLELWLSRGGLLPGLTLPPTTSALALCEFDMNDHNKYCDILQGKVQVLGNVELMTKAFESR